MSNATGHAILLESGTNEVEVLVFALRKQRYGVNVAKVREVIEPLNVTVLPQLHDAVAGVFQLRDTVTPLIDLQRCLGHGDNDLAKGKIMILEFNDARVGFLVDSVEQIHRVSWSKVTAVPDIDGLREAPVTSVVHIGDDMVLMIDFEKLMFDVGGVDLFEQSAKSISCDEGRGHQRILMAEDSHVMQMLIKNNLAKAGYVNVEVCNDGQEAWERLEAELATGVSPVFDMIITDIEMPRIDGLHLTQRIKEHPQLGSIPVVIFSSLVSIDNQKKCEAVGANAQITKPQLGELVDLCDRLTGMTSQPAAALA